MWALSKIEDTGSAYQEAMAFRLRGDLDQGALEAALGHILKRHEVLRSSYPSVDGEMTVRIRDLPAFTVSREDASGASADAIRRRLSGFAEQQYDLESGPLIRVLLLNLSGEEHLLAVGMHHLVCDDWSWEVFFRELALFYRQGTAGEPAGLPPLVAGFFEHAARQRGNLESEADGWQGDIAYWRDQLRDAPALLFPTSHRRPARQTYAGDVVRFPVSSRLREAMEELASSEGSTLSTVLLGLFQLFLARYAGQGDVVVGIPATERSDPELAGIIGYFLNPLAIRARIGRESTVREVCRGASVAVTSALNHSAVPFDQVVNAVGARRDPGRHPLFQAMYQFREHESARPDLVGLAVSPETPDRHAAMFDLTLHAVNRRDGLQCELAFRTDLYSRRFIEDCAERFLSLSARAVEMPDVPAMALPLLTDAEARDLTERRAGDHRPSLAAGSFLEWVEAQVRMEPERPAVEDDPGEQWSYGKLWDYSGRIAAALLQKGVDRESVVGVNLERGATMLGVLLGILRSGAAYLPLDPDFPPARLAYMVEDSGARLVVSDDPLPGFGRIETIAPEALAEPGAERPPDELPGTEDLAYLIYTSGSTGRPKGVEVHHGALRNVLGSLQDTLNLDAEDRLLAVTTLSFDISGVELFLPLCAGAQVMIPDADTASDGVALLERFQASEATVMQATPATWRMLLDADWGGGLRTLLCGGEALPPALAGELLERADQVWNLYGPTETTIWSMIDRVAPDEPVRVGRPLANTRVYVLDPGGNPVPDGVSGEIWIGGAGVARGYHARPELTGERFRPELHVNGERMYRTGDLGRWQPDGRLEHLGRADFQYKVHGFRIEAGEVEAAMEALPEVRQAVVMARGEAEDRRLVAYVVFREGQAPLAGEIRRRLATTLPQYMIPGLVLALDAMPLTPGGKVDRNALPDPLDSATRRPEHEPPADAVERAIADVWQQLLEVDRVGRHDNFFELGGHSLLAMRAVAALEKRVTNAGLQPRELYYLSVAQLATQARGNGSTLLEGH